MKLIASLLILCFSLYACKEPNIVLANQSYCNTTVSLDIVRHIEFLDDSTVSIHKGSHNQSYKLYEKDNGEMLFVKLKRIPNPDPSSLKIISSVDSTTWIYLQFKGKNKLICYDFIERVEKSGLPNLEKAKATVVKVGNKNVFKRIVL